MSSVPSGVVEDGLGGRELGGIALWRLAFPGRIRRLSSSEENSVCCTVTSLIDRNRTGVM